ncbi:unnamed protein product, partial [Discosporangium mesarthrocarpum]
GGSLGCAEGEKITRAFEYGREHGLAVVVQCRSGGARMQEGTMSLMQMAKVCLSHVEKMWELLDLTLFLPNPTSSELFCLANLKVAVAVDALRREAIPFVSVLADPTYGGVSASYAMQADVRVALEGARIGFAGPAVILNTMFEMDQ